MIDARRDGLEAAAHNEWQRAHELLRQALASAPEDPEVLVAIGDCAWWLRLQDEAIERRERAYQILYSTGDREGAALVALKLVRDHAAARGDSAVASGWLRRAAELLEDAAPSSAVAQLRLAQSRAAGNDLIAADRLADETIELARRAGDHDTEMLATAWKGMLLVGKGEVAAGLGLQDASLAAAVGGELGPMATMLIYCWLVYSCEYVGDVARADEWSDHALRSCERRSIRTFPGICLLHRARLLRLRGAWDEAEAEASRALEIARTTNKDVHASALLEIAEICRRRGDLERAWELTEGAAAARGGTPESIRALVIADRQGPEAAFSYLDRSLRAPQRDRFSRARLIPPFVELALALGRADQVDEHVSELEELAGVAGTHVLRAYAAGTRGRLELARGDADAACARLQEAVNAWRATDVPYEGARDRVALAAALAARGDRAGAETEAAEALRVLEELGARPDAERTRELLVGLRARPATTTALMFVDVVSSTPLVEAIGDEAWRDLAQWLETTLRGIFQEQRGREVDHAGDGFFVVFDRPADAIECARRIQRRLVSHRREHGYAPQVRIGIHAGAVIDTGGGLRGAAVHRAARICGLAEGGQIVASREALEAAETRGERPRRVALKGVRDAVEVADVSWSASA